MQEATDQVQQIAQSTSLLSMIVSSLLANMLKFAFVIAFGIVVAFFPKDELV